MTDPSTVAPDATSVALRPGSSLSGAVSTSDTGGVGPEYPTGQPVTTPDQLPGREAVRKRTRVWSPATYLLLGINIGVFILMVASGVNAKLPSESSLLHFGANNAWLVLHGQWWRLVTAMFVHVGLIHLATNMWCLWNLGLLGEPLLGFFGMIAVYLLTGVAGNLLSVAASVLSELLVNSPLVLLVRWTGASMEEVGAGASGAVFGIAGILIVLLSNRRLAEPRNGHAGIPFQELKQLRKSVMNFAGINLLIGLSTVILPLVRIDNMAHLGGFVSGLALGVPLLPRMTSGRQRYLQRQQITFAAGALLLALAATMISRLRA